MEDDVPYLLRGMQPVDTDSSVLLSSSKYLNDIRLRDWVTTQFLRRNGPDYPPQSASYTLRSIVDGLRDHDELNTLIKAERQIKPKLDAWFEERFLSTFTKEDLAHYAPDSVGGIFHQCLENGFEINIISEITSSTDAQYFVRRSLQIHDFEHIITGASFDHFGEVGTVFAKMTNLFKHLSPKLAGDLSVYYIFVTLQYVTRALLHYPETFLAVIGSMQRGIRIGLSSDEILLNKYESVFHLRVDEAREELGIREAEDVDTSEMSRIFEGMIPDALALG